MKTHSPALCGRVPLVCRSSFTGGLSQQDLSCMLRELEEEYTILQCEQQELASVLQERSGVDSPEELSQLQDELYKIEARLTSKVEHIKIIKAQSKCHQHKRPATHRRSSSVTIPADGEVEIITTVKPKQSSCPTTPKKNCKLLYNMKSLQNTIQRDDLSWN
ncbi:centrosomal protein of 57 kDa-like [Dysidea avara]|uniref:centrosomal protein of 57 kDa-like n=1 Tax=Dysidea avara TaxID=196820 RepID=UPI0033222631